MTLFPELSAWMLRRSAVIGVSYPASLPCLWAPETNDLQAWVLDSVPGEVPEDNSGVPEVLETVKVVSL